MKQELAWGAAAAVAIVAAVGISSQPAGKPQTSSPPARVGTKSASKTKPRKGVQPQCEDSISLLEHFFLHENVAAPDVCYEAGGQPATASNPDLEFQPTFVIATVPDPLHTHFSLLFDRFIEAIQQGAQDEGYEYDSSWLPWETEEPQLVMLADQDESDDRKTKREDQPGILLFRYAKDTPSSASEPYKKALIVFIVGEEPTRGIHRMQFENAVAWIEALQTHGAKSPPVAILGPTFSGSLPSLNELISADKLASRFNRGTRLAIYTGSASSRDDGRHFASEMRTMGADFRSFVQDDDTLLGGFCRWVGRRLDGSFDVTNVAILSEDETAYGNMKEIGDSRSTKEIDNCPSVTRLYYPRDISTLRAAYQSQSMFSTATTQQSQDSAQRKSLPTDLADPGGEQHDTVRTYAGNQTPLSQEAQLLGIVEALRANGAQYVVLRSSNTLDPLFLANFLRRDYPEARVVVRNSDLLFQRGQDAMALSGVMTLSTYPLFSWARDWTEQSPYDAHSHRVFPEDSTEGTYIASRLLLQTLARADGETPALNCEFSDQEVFAPSLRCEPDHTKPYAPLPDYSPPYWTEAKPCTPNSLPSRCRPAAWLSVIKGNGTWPLAALSDRTLLSHPEDPPSVENLEAAGAGTDAQAKKPTSSGRLRWPRMPGSTRVLLIALCGCAAFHWLCCRFASFTAKPAFRAHFATGGHRHTGLVLIGSYLVTQMTLLAGWSCGLFSKVPSPPRSGFAVWAVVVLVCVVAGTGMVTNFFVTKRLGADAGDPAFPAVSSALRVSFWLSVFVLLLSAFFWTWVNPLEEVLAPATRAFVYYRSMHLTSGVSPIVPFLSMTMGLYFWFWYALHGQALFGPDRPCLPPLAKLGIKIPGSEDELKLTMFSQETAGTPAERIATPLAWDNVTLLLALFTGFALLVACLSSDVPVRSLGARKYALIYCFWLDFYFSLILVEAWQIWRTWSSTRQLLVFLDRLAMRRTLGALHGFSWGSVWKMSGNVLDVRYKLLSRQLECLNHLHRSIVLFADPKDSAEQAAFARRSVCRTAVEATQAAGLRFAEWYSRNFNDPKAADLQRFGAFQKQVAQTTGVVLTELLIPATRTERHSLIQADPDSKSDVDRRPGPAPSRNELIRNAEELVCLTYLGYAQNLLGRIRTIVLGGMYLFVAATIAVSSYPFDPRPLLSGVLLSLFLAFGAVVVFVYADMHRDATLSHVTNTNPGELGSEFWFKVVGYGAAPVLGLITQIFPEWSGFLFSWLQPGLSSLK
jgi:hypothetical protein